MLLRKTCFSNLYIGELRSYLGVKVVAAVLVLFGSVNLCVCLSSSWGELEDFVVAVVEVVEAGVWTFGSADRNNPFFLVANR